MDVQLKVGADPTIDTSYLTWTPLAAELKVTDSQLPRPGPVQVTLRTRSGPGGKLAFRQRVQDPESPELTLSVQSDGDPTTFLISGLFQSPSTVDGDAVLEVVYEGSVAYRRAFMVRIRKNAESLTTSERDSFLEALATINTRGLNGFDLFRSMHTAESSAQAHGDDGFFPWHRAYILDLERELQQIDPEVALPYWRFNEPAPNLFNPAFIGGPPSAGDVVARLAASNPLRAWATDGVPGIARTPQFNTATDAARVMSTEVAVVGSTSPYATFRKTVEGDPHGSSHVSFSGLLSSIPTAARDPLFFLLHCNVDRLWAKWQWFKKRFDPARTNVYKHQGQAGAPGSTTDGHNRHDTMWPWNNITNTNGRPQTAPRTPFAPSAQGYGPGPKPTVGELIDFQGHHGASPLGFDYDDVPFEKATT